MQEDNSWRRIKSTSKSRKKTPKAPGAVIAKGKTIRPKVGGRSR